MSDEALPRPGSTADLVQRMDRIERNHDVLAREVGALTATVKTVESNQKHAEDINKLRFDAIERSVNDTRTDLKGFMARIEGMLTGEVETNQTREARERVEEWEGWRKGVDTFITQGRFAGALAKFAVGGNLLAIAAAIYALLK